MAQQIKITQTSNADMNIGVTKKITAVEWFLQELIRFGWLKEGQINITLKQAKQMEKEQIIQAASLVLWHNSANSIEEAEKYYNETYGENKD